MSVLGLDGDRHVLLVDPEDQLLELLGVRVHGLSKPAEARRPGTT
jgi:hypothetical protein